MPDADKILVRVRVNGEHRESTVEPRTLLVEFLRDHLNLTGHTLAVIPATVAHVPCC